MNGIPILTALILLPILGAVLTACVPSARAAVARTVALGFSLATLAVAIYLWTAFDNTSGSLQFIERAAWIPALDVSYFLGLDGLSLLLVLLTACLTPFALTVPLRATKNLNVYYALVLALQGMVLGVFLAQNFILWFLFWELTLLPAFFLIKIWGGPVRTAAAYQFFIYTLAGSIAMLLGFLALYLATGMFDFTALAELARDGKLIPAMAARFAADPEFMLLLVFVGIFLGLAVKVPVFPFHTWLPEAYAQAPTGVTMLLTGLLSKMGLYGFLRILLPVFPEQIQAMQNLLLALAVATIILPALAALAQSDLKRILAYSSINHLGYCLLGVFAVMAVAPDAAGRQAALSGVYLQLFNHGVIASALFCFVGLIEIRCGGRRGLADFGGLRKVAPVLCGLMGISLFASVGLPGLSGFVGEFLIFKGTFALVGWAAVLALPGLLITAVFLLRVLARVFSGPLNREWLHFPDLSSWERIRVAPAVALIIVFGIYPAPLLSMFNQTVVVTLQFLP